MTDSRSAKTIGLLTPYTGGNLGDGAIQEAVIRNIKKRLPDALIWGITLCPEDTKERHKIPAFPLTALSVHGYSAFVPVNLDSPPRNRFHSSDSSGFRGKIKRIRLLYQCITAFRSLSRGIRRSLRIVSGEVHHIIGTYKFTKRLDLLLVSGGGQIDDYWGGPWGHPYALFKWAVTARLTRTKFAVLSVGRGTLDSWLSRFFVRHSLRCAFYRSYRDDTSKSLLEEDGTSFTRHDPVLPDLAFSYVRNSHSSGPRRKDGGVVVGVSPIAYLSRYGWPRSDGETFGAYTTKLAAFVTDLMKKEYTVLFFSTDTPDRHAIEEIADILKKDASLNPERAIFDQPTLTVEDLFSQLSTVDYVVASRLHGVLLSHLAGRPVLALSYDRKVKTYMEEMDQARYCLDIHCLDPAALHDGFATLEANAEAIRLDLGARIARYTEQLGAQYDEVLERT